MAKIKLELEFDTDSNIFLTSFLSYNVSKESISCHGRLLITHITLSEFIEYSVRAKLGIVKVDGNFIPVIYTYNEGELDCYSLLNSENFTAKEEDLL